MVDAWSAGPPGRPCFIVFVFPRPPATYDPPGRALHGRSKTHGQEVETDAATQADHAQQPAATKRKGVELMAAATRPRRDKTGPAATGATQKSGGLGAFFNLWRHRKMPPPRKVRRQRAVRQWDSQLSKQLRRSSASLARRDMQRMVAMVCHDP